MYLQHLNEEKRMTKSEEIEEWRLITEFPVYEASNLGRIRNKQTKRVLKPWSGGTSVYYMLCLCFNKLKTKILVHRVVLSTFKPHPKYKSLQVNHIDGNKLNNNINNLEWVSRQQNIDHSVLNGLNCKGSKHGNSKLNESQVIEIREILKHKKKRRQRPYYKDVASQFNVDRKVIEDIHKNKSWRHVK